MATFVVDTHALLFYLADSRRLGRAAEAALDSTDSRLILPVIVLAEALWIVSSRDVGLSVRELISEIEADARFGIVDLTRQIVERSHELTSISEMHDRQIVATALLLDEEAVLLTKDANIIESGLLQTLW